MAAHSPRLTCLCGAISQTFSVALPAPSMICHCDPCRQICGSLMATFVELPYAPEATLLDKCTTYHSSATHDRLFCSTCGSKTLLHLHHYPDGRERDEWYAYSGVIERPEGEAESNIVRAGTNEFVKETLDGGLAPHMTQLGGRQIPAYAVREGSSRRLAQTDLYRMSQTPISHPSPGPEERLKAVCRCGSVKLLIKPANHTPESIAMNFEHLIPITPTGEKLLHKYQARTCVCRSCRLNFGVSLTAYTYLPPAQVLNAHTGESLAYGHAVETAEGQRANRGLEALKYYQSSKEACRSFCGMCGSTVFYWHVQRPDLVNVAAGILRAEEGALARRWLYWQPGMVSFTEDEHGQVVDREILDAYVKADVN